MPSSRPSNVRDFKPPSPPSIWAARIYSTILYLFLGGIYIFPTGGPGDMDFNLTFLLVILYWAFIQQEVHRHPRFKQSLVLVAIIAALVLFVYRSIAIPLALLVLLYWLLIVKTRGNSYFLRYHILSALVSGTILCLAFLCAFCAFKVVFHLATFVGFGAAIAPVGVMWHYAYLSAGIVLCGGVFLYMAMGALLGKTPRLPFVTANVQYMA